MSSNESRVENLKRFLLWVGSNLLLGLLPCIVTIVVYLMFEGRSEAIRVENLMFFIIMLVATTMIDMVVAKVAGLAGSILWPVLILFVALAAFFMGLNALQASVYPDVPRALSRLRLLSVILTFFAVLVTVSAQVHLRFYSGADHD